MEKVKNVVFLVAIFFVTMGASCVSAEEGGLEYPFLDTSLSNGERAADLVSRLTLEEKAVLMNEVAGAVPRLGIKKYRYWNEALHGVARSGKYTVFTQAAGLAATWNPELIERVGTAISDEAWAGLNRDSAETGYPPEKHLTFWSPTINMARDPRWGRTPETYGEDPFLTSQIALGFIRGMQGYDERYIKVVATPKHFVANNTEFNRLSGSAEVSEKMLREYYFPAFKATVIEGNAQSVMGAYNALNGVPCNANEWLLTDVLRGEWGFDGFVVTDCGAVSNLISQHKYAKDGAEATAFTVKAGAEIECGGANIIPKHLVEAVERGLVSEERIDEAMMNIMIGRMRLGMFDPPEMNPYTKIPPETIGSGEHVDLARHVARESIVLLKNAETGGKKLLPINRDEIKSIAVVGPYGNKLEYGDYTGEPANEPVTLLGGVKNRVGEGVEVTIIDWMPIPGPEAFSLVPEGNLKTAGGSAGLDAAFFDNPELKGEPAVKRVDGNIYFKSGRKPELGSGPYSVRWSGKVTADNPGAHIFSVKARGVVRFYIDGEKVLDFKGVKKKEKKLQSGNEITFNDMKERDPDMKVATLFMEEGVEYEIAMEYVPVKKSPLARLEWMPPAGNFLESKKQELEAIKNADIVLAAVGYEREDEVEGMDRETLKLPLGEEEYVVAAAGLNPNTVGLITSGSPVAVLGMEESVPAILMWWYPGEQGGNGVADVLFGDYNPAGRLPFTAYRSIADLVDFEDYDISKGITYMYFKGDPLYPFGYGLSYSQFEYSDLSAEVTDGKVTVSFKVANVGAMDGDEVSQVYVRDPESEVVKPLKKLHGFKRVAVKSGETEEVSISFNVEKLSHWDEGAGGFSVEPGEYEIMLGASSADVRLRTSIVVE